MKLKSILQYMVSVLLLQAIIVIYAFATVMAKFASRYPVISLGFIKFILLDLLALGIYSICWQQLLKKFDLSFAYANRAMAIVWGAVFAVLIFNERITALNLAGVALIAAGVTLLNEGIGAPGKNDKDPVIDGEP